VEVFRLDEVGHVLWLGWRGAVVIVAVSVVVRVRVVRRANVVHLVGGTALHAAGLGLVAGELGNVSKDCDSEGRGGRTVIQRTLCESAGKPVQPQYCSLPAELTMIGSSGVPIIHQPSFPPSHQLFSRRSCSIGFLLKRTEAASIQRLHVEDVNALHLSQDFETLQTGSLFEVGRHGTGLRTRRQKISLSLDLYKDKISAIGLVFSPLHRNRGQARESGIATLGIRHTADLLVAFYNTRSA